MASMSLFPRIPSRPIPNQPPVPRRNSHSDGFSVGGRRSLAIPILLLHFPFALPNRADAANPFDKYVKRKKLEPLEAYVPAVLLSQAQFKDLEKYLDVDQPKYDVTRSLLRSGPAASLRVNIRAVAQYATDDGNGKAASDAVDQCLRALEDLDSLLLRATRRDPAASVGSMKSKISIAVGALDSLLQTVPSLVLDKGKAIADAYGNSSYEEEDSKPGELDPDLKKLEAIL
ncbi:uncharacterized protein M6B38_408020 [Iris pallida]|uniref:DUF7880 domain-containing protein n=1 Tax=Iris pallida TaxID=29817 RepID=A0AAX6FPN5_IRIPA|nr:uncharacterized protein M6B38_408020 [Iris pallida]